MLSAFDPAPEDAEPTDEMVNPKRATDHGQDPDGLAAYARFRAATTVEPDET